MSTALLNDRVIDECSSERRWPIGAELTPSGGVDCRVWAPRAALVEVAILDHDGEHELERFRLEPDRQGYHRGRSATAGAGAWYGFYVDGDSRLLADPMSRYQPKGPHGPSEVVDPEAFQWSDNDWAGLPLRGQVLYEMHVGTFTTEGNWRAAAEQLPELARLGITVIEIMPVAEFCGRFGWGYDGVNLFAPTRLYGKPDDFRAFVDRAHGLGLAVILDVVYNHLGPDGNVLLAFSEDYFSPTWKTDWGQAINFFGQRSGPVREYFLANAAYWISEFHLDGLRLDATQDLHDESEQHILAAISQTVRHVAAGRHTILIAENEPQDTKLVRPPPEGGFGIDGLWNDDFHHSAMVVLSGHNEAYYSDHRGRPQEFISAAKYGYLYQGQRYSWQKKRRGTSTRGLPPENHDQLANTGRGLRCHLVSNPGDYRAMTALLLLGPGTPMLFQGQEFAAASPFYYFADHEEALAERVYAGRKQFMSQFRSLATPEVQARLPNPADPATFIRCKLDFADRMKHGEAYALHEDLLRLRREDPVIRMQGAGGLDGAVLGDDAFLLRFFGEEGNDRLLVVNFGRDQQLSPAPEPLLAPPAGEWQILWSSEDPIYGGGGTPPLEADESWRLPGHAAVVLAPSA